MMTVWDGVLKSISLEASALDARIKLADAAKSYDWDTVFDILSAHSALANSCRPDGNSLFAPLHQAAYAGASAEVVGRLVELGAWRTLRNARGERAADVAEQRGHRHLRTALAPLLKHDVPAEMLSKIQSSFHQVIRDRIDRKLPNHGMRLPELEPLLELTRPQMWFPVQGMYGGFSYWLASTAPVPRLVCESWSRVVDGSGQRHEIDLEGSRLVDEGFV